MGQLAAIGIVKGKPFAPDERMRRILDDAAAVGTATSRALFFDAARDRKGSRTTTARRGSTCCGSADTRSRRRRRWSPTDGIKPFPATGARKQNSRTSFFYAATGITPAMCMRLTGIGSQYLIAFMDADGEPPRRRARPTGDPAAGHPGGPVLVAHPLRQPDALDARRRRSASRAPAASPTRRRRRPRTPTARRPSPSARSSPRTVPEGNWIQTTRGKGWFPILRLYSPLAAVLRQVLAPERNRVLAY